MMLFDLNSIKNIDNPVIKYIFDHIIIFVVIAFLIMIFIYSLLAVLLNKLNNVKYGKTSWMAWIPIFRSYLLGKLTIHPIVGIILAIGYTIGIVCSLEINGVSSIFPEEIIAPFFIIYLAIVIVLYIYAFFKIGIERRKGKSMETIDYIDSNKISEYDQKYSDKKTINEPVINNKEKEIDNIYSGFSNEGNSFVESKVKLQDINKMNNNISSTLEDHNKQG